MMKILHTSVIGSALFVAALVILTASQPEATAATVKKPLRVHNENPIWLDDGTGKAVMLTGSHTWWNLSDMWTNDPPRQFDFNKYLTFLKANNHNFIRLWRYEMPRFKFAGEPVSYVSPHPWARTGPGTANDGKPKFNLNKYDSNYFKRLTSRVNAAQKQGIYVGVMLFEGHALADTQQGWQFHPLNPANNVQGIGPASAEITHSNDDPEVLKVQRKYVRKVLQQLNKYNNVLYEISNEGPWVSEQWQEGMVKYVQKQEAKLPKQHLVIMSTLLGGKSDHLWSSKAQIAAPGDNVDAYRFDPPVNDGHKVVILDTDHLWGCGGDPQWVFKAFTRGYHPIYMDAYYNNNPYCPAPDKQIRKRMGYALKYANKMNLAQMTPQPEVASTGYALVNPGSEYLVYAPDGGQVTVELASGSYSVEWFNPNTNKTKSGGQASGIATLQSPYSGDVLLYLKRK